MCEVLEDYLFCFQEALIRDTVLEGCASDSDDLILRKFFSDSIPPS